MSGIDILPYALFAGIVLASILAVVLAGPQAWVVPAIALPATLAYVLFDRRLKQRERDSA